MNKPFVILALALVAAAAGAESYTKTINWNTSVTSGWLTDPGLWTGGVAPEGAGELGLFGNNKTSVCLTCPTGVSTTRCSFVFLRNTDTSVSRSIVLDARQGTWVHRAKWLSSWQGCDFGGQNVGAHVFNIEDLSSGGTNTMFTLSGGTLTYRTGSRNQVVLDGGTWDMYPNNTAGGAPYLGASGSIDFVSTNGANVRAKQLLLRECSGAKVSATFYGGSHYLLYGITVNQAENNAGLVDFVDADMTCQKLVIGDLGYGNVAKCYSKTMVTNAISVRGSSYLTVREVDSVIGNTASTNPTVTAWATLDMRDNAVVDFWPDSNIGVHVGGRYTTRSDARNRATILVRDNAQLVQRGRMDIGSGISSDARVILSGNGIMKSPNTYGYVYVGNKERATGRVEVTDHAVFESNGEVSYGNNVTLGTGLADISGYGTYTVKGVSRIGNGVTSLGQLRIREHASGNLANVRIGIEKATRAGSCVIVDGEDADLLVNGTVYMQGLESAFCVTSGVCEVLGTEFTLGKCATDSGLILSVDGGTLLAPNAPIVCGDVAGSTARVELTGGAEVTAKSLAVGAGSATFRADGATVSASSGASSDFFGGFSSAVLGADGLTIDTAGHAVQMPQAFADAAGEAGLFVKAGAGTMTATMNSAHARTEISGGTLQLGEGVSQFGRDVKVSGSGILSLPEAGEYAFGSLSLGDASGCGALMLGADTTIAVTGTMVVADGVLLVPSLTENGTYRLFTCSNEVSAASVANLRILDQASGKSYAFSRSADGKSIDLTVADVTPETATWQGATSTDWATLANWTSATRVPGAADAAVFPDGATRTEVEVPAATGVRSLSFTGTSSDYVLAGEMLRGLAGVSSAGGHQVVSNKLEVNSDFAVTVTSGDLELAGSLQSVEGSLTKSGSGALRLTGDNAKYPAALTLAGGRLALEGANGGGMDVVGVGLTATGDAGCVLEFTNATDVTVTRGIESQVNAPFAIDVRGGGDVALPQPLVLKSGAACGLVKTGPGKVTVDYPSGSYYLSRAQGNCGSNRGPSGNATFGADGNTPAWTGLGGMSILDGTLHVRGQGRSKTSIYQQHWGYVGGGSWMPEGDVGVVFDAVRAYLGGSGMHWWTGQTIPSRTGAKPTVTAAFVNGTEASSDTLKFGYGGTACHANCALIVSNSTVSSTYGFSMPNGNIDGTMIVRVIGSSAKLVNTRNDDGATEPGFGLYGAIDFLADEGATMEMGCASGAGTQVKFGAASRGTMKFAKATLTGCGFRWYNDNAATDGVNVIFDGATFKYYNGGRISLVPSHDKNHFTVAAGGLTLEAASGRTPQLTFPMEGPGTLTKTGTGTLLLGPNISGYHGLKPFVTNDAPVVGCARFVVSADPVVCAMDGAVSENTVVEVAESKTLDLDDHVFTCGGLVGAGAVANGVFAGRVSYVANATELPELRDVTFADGRLNVDFGRTETSDPLPRHVALPICRLTGTTPKNVTIRGVNRGMGTSVTFVVQDGVVSATAASAGMTLIFR